MIELFRYFLVLAACVVWTGSSHAGRLPDFRQIGTNNAGRSVTFGPTGQGTQWGSAVPVAPPITGGWQYAGNYGVPATATGTTLTMSAGGDVFIAGTKYPFQAGYTVDKSAVLDGVIGVASLLGGWPGLVASGAVGIAAWMQSSNVKVNPNATGPNDEFLLMESGLVCTPPPNVVASCAATRNTYVALSPSPIMCWRGGQTPGPNYSGYWNTSQNLYGFTYNNGSNQFHNCYSQAYAVSETGLPKSMDDIAPYMRNSPMPGAVVQEVLDRGGSIELPTPSITGPASVDAGSKETVHPDGSKTVTNVTNNFTINNNTITYDNRTTTTTTYNSAGVKTGTETEVEETEDNEFPSDTPLAEIPELYKQKYPDGLAGVWGTRKAEMMATPLGQLSTNLMPNLAGEGVCPAWMIDLDFAVPGWSYGERNVAPPCWVWGFGQVVIVISALLLARALIFGG
ncbi:hypothetical protein [Variovorax sp. VNK109]|uniref:hypothetical protein n=1 Tax=Variovorax sp. VNK109 TaxID=3400919 RepID=UPI003C2EFC9C